MALIQDINLTVSGNFSFLNIPQNYKHLRLYLIGRTTNAVVIDSADLRFNNDSTGNYDGLIIINTSATLVGAFEDIGFTFAQIGQIPGANATTNYFSQCVVEVGDYTSGAHTKSLISQTGQVGASSTGNLQTAMSHWMWRQTVPITRIDLLAAAPGQFAIGSRASLYGIV